MKTIRQHIRDQEFKNVYLLYGDQPYLISRYKMMLKDAICTEETMNYTYYEGKDISVKELLQTLMTPPFFTERRLVIVENCGYFKKSADEIVEGLKKAAPTSYVIFVDNEIDKRNKLFKYVSANGYAAELKAPTERDIMVWLSGEIRKAGCKVSEDTLKYFIAMTGDDMNTMMCELMKLIGYVGNGNVITEEAIDRICIKQAEAKVFDMIDRVAEGDRNEALKQYKDLIDAKEEPIGILALISRHYGILYNVKSLLDGGYSSASICDKLNLRNYFIGRYIKQAGGYSSKQLFAIMDECAEIDRRLKSGMAQKEFEVETFIIRLGKIAAERSTTR